jgi:hypothetical protein
MAALVICAALVVVPTWSVLPIHWIAKLAVSLILFF